MDGVVLTPTESAGRSLSETPGRALQVGTPALKTFMALQNITSQQADFAIINDTRIHFPLYGDAPNIQYGFASLVNASWNSVSPAVLGPLMIRTHCPSNVAAALAFTASSTPGSDNTVRVAAGDFVYMTYSIAWQQKNAWGLKLIHVTNFEPKCIVRGGFAPYDFSIDNSDVQSVSGFCLETSANDAVLDGALPAGDRDYDGNLISQGCALTFFLQFPCVVTLHLPSKIHSGWLQPAYKTISVPVTPPPDDGSGFFWRLNTWAAFQAIGIKGMILWLDRNASMPDVDFNPVTINNMMQITL